MYVCVSVCVYVCMCVGVTMCVRVSMCVWGGGMVCERDYVRACEC